MEEFHHRKINFLTELKIPAIYKGKNLDVDFRCDFYVEQSMIVEIKAVQELTPFYEAQLLNFMKLLKCPKGILINFNCSNIFNEGQKTFVNEYFSILPTIKKTMYLCGVKNYHINLIKYENYKTYLCSRQNRILL